MEIRYWEKNKKYQINYLKRREQEYPLVSIIVISYNNQKFLPESVKSVLSQEYSNIELIVSDDGTKDFSLEQMKTLLAKEVFFKGKKEVNVNLYQNGELEKSILDRYENIQRICFNRNAVNSGTVKHLKYLKSIAKGKYIMFLAADDKLHDEKVVIDLIDYFETLPEDAYILTSQCGMYDYTLQNLYYFVLNDDLKQILLSMDSRRIFEELTKWCFIPAAGTIYKKKVFDIFGDLDDRYHLIEDWTYFLKLSRKGARIYFLDRLTYMHRDGGISHGNVNGSNEAWRHYQEDSLLLMEQEMLPYLDKVTPKQAQKIKKKYKNLKREIFIKYELKEKNRKEKIDFVFSNMTYYGKRLMELFLGALDLNAIYIVKAGGGILLAGILCLNSNVREIAWLFGAILEVIGLLSIFTGIVIKLLWKIVRYGRKICGA